LQFYISKKFHSEFKKLKKKKAKYHCIAKSLYSEFFDKTDDEIKERGDYLNNSNSETVIKKKRSASCGNNGKSYGFRILSIVNIEKGTCGLFMIYPKWGPFAKQNVLKEEWKPRLTEYIEDQNRGNLLEMKFNKKKKEVYFEASSA